MIPFYFQMLLAGSEVYLLEGDSLSFQNSQVSLPSENYLAPPKTVDILII